MAGADRDEEDLFVSQEETLGGVEDEFGPSFFILLRNFDLNSDLLKAAHLEILRDRVVPFVKNRVGFSEIYGMTDRSGSRQLNYQVAGRRLVSVQQGMLGLGAPSAKVQHLFAKAIGEDFFEARHAADKDDKFFSDGLKKAALRVVVIGLTPAPIGVPTRIFRGRTAGETVSFCRRHVQVKG